MPPLSLNQAAKEAHKSKAAILEAIRTGRMSAIKDDKNQWQIDPAELFRCYPQNQTGTGNENRGQPVEENRSTTDLLEQILSNLKDERDRERQQLQATIDDLRRRLDEEASERRRLMNILTHQPEPAQNQAKTESRLLKKLFGR